MLTVRLTTKSQNEKVGPIPVSTTSAHTCPDSCPLKAGGCYAKGGPLSIFWRKVTEGKVGTDWHTFTAKVAALPEGQLWRHNQAGDLPGEADAIDGEALAELVAANRGRRGFTYTHKPMTETNAAAVAAANDGGFTVNLSANSPHHADELAALGVGPVVTVLPIDAPEHTATPAGRPIVVCPAVTGKAANCAACGLCQRVNRKVIVGFPAHGYAKNKAAAIAAALKA